MSDTIDYGNRMHRAMRGLIASVLSDVGESGLPGDHHFFITYDTTHPDAEMPDWLRERYPDEITIVIQHWFEALSVDDDGFHITLNFGDQPVPLYVPFDALMNFVDPAVEFGLVFRHTGAEDEAQSEIHLVEDDAEPDGFELPSDTPGEDSAPDADTPARDGDVVSLDSFRK